jgi:hypothetical protein
MCRSNMVLCLTIRSASALIRNYILCCLFQATYSADEPSETCSKISLVDLAGRLVITGTFTNQCLVNGECIS